MAERKLFVHWGTKKLQVSDRNGGVVTLPPFNKYEVIPFKVVIVEDDTEAVGLPRFARVGVAPLSMSMALNDTYDDATPIAYQNTFTKDESDNTFSGVFSINTAAMSTFLGSSESKEALFEIEIQEGSNVNKIYQATVTVRNSVSQVGAVVPSPVDEYFTKAQTIAQFLQHFNAAGIQGTFVSPNGVYQRIIGVNDEGQSVDQII